MGFQFPCVVSVSTLWQQKGHMKSHIYPRVGEKNGDPLFY